MSDSSFQRWLINKTLGILLQEPPETSFSNSKLYLKSMF